jgi:hypothetical protein
MSKNSTLIRLWISIPHYSARIIIKFIVGIQVIRFLVIRDTMTCSQARELKIKISRNVNPKFSQNHKHVLG